MEKCINHPGRPALSFCFSCKRYFCSQCLVEGSEHYYCKDEECQKKWEREVLPANMQCPYCAVELELDENERKRKQLYCPVCKKSIDLRESSHQLGKTFVESVMGRESYRLTGEVEPLISDTEEGEKEYRCLFEGEGASLFGIYFSNGLLSGGIFFVLSLLMIAFVGISGESGVSIPLIIIWYIAFILAFAFMYAFLKFRIYEFYYSNVKFGDGHLFFTGTLKEIYKGILKALLFSVVFAIAFFVIIFAIGGFVELSTFYLNLTMQIVIYLTLFVVLQYAYFNSRRYRFSRILYRRKVFSLKGDLIQFTKKCILNGLLSIFTLGIYLPVYFHRRFAMLFNNLYYGNEPFRYKGKDKEFFKITLEGFFLTVLTLGVYYFWWKPRRYNYYIQHLGIGEARFHSDIKPGPLFKLLITNFFLIVFTLGIATPWAEVRRARFYLSETRVIGDLDSLLAEEPPEGVETEATGDAVADYFGLGGVGMF